MDIGIFISIFFVALIGLYIFLKKSCIVVEQGTSVVVERFGRFLKRVDKGWTPLIPWIDTPRTIVWRSYDITANSKSSMYKETKTFRIEMRQTIYDLPLQSIITRDNVEIMVHPMMRIEVIDPVRVAYETFDLFEAVERLVQTSLRSVIGDMGLDDTLASRQEIEKLVSNKVFKVCRDWGLNVNSVDLLEIDPTPTIQAAMHEQIRAERYRRTQKVTAEGYSEQVRLTAEGNCQAAKSNAVGESERMKLIAKGNSDARLIVAEKTAESLRLLSTALKDVTKDPTQYLIGMQYVKLINQISPSTKVDLYLPYQTDVSGAAALN